MACCSGDTCSKILTLGSLDTLLSGHSVTSDSSRILLNHSGGTEANWWRNNSGRTVMYDELTSGYYSGGSIGMGIVSGTSEIVSLPFVDKSDSGVSGVFVESTYIGMDGDIIYYSGDTENTCCSGDSAIVREGDVMIRTISGTSTSGNFNAYCYRCDGYMTAFLTLPRFDYKQIDYYVCPSSSVTNSSSGYDAIESVEWSGIDSSSSSSSLTNFSCTGYSSNFIKSDISYNGQYVYSITSGDTITLTIRTSSKSFSTACTIYMESYVDINQSDYTITDTSSSEPAYNIYNDCFGGYDNISLELDCGYGDEDVITLDSNGNLYVTDVPDNDFDVVIKDYCDTEMARIHFTVSVTVAGAIKHDPCCDGGGSLYVGKKFTDCNNS